MGYLPLRLRRGRKSLREKMTDSLAAQRMYFSGMEADDPRRAQNEERLNKLAAEIAPKRHRVVRPVDGKPVVRLEKHVLADVLQAMRQDPRIAIVERTQSGVFQEHDRFIRIGTPGKLDITFMLAGSGRYGEIEVKRPGEKPNERQATRIAYILKHGGISGYATSAEEAIALLP